MRLSQAGYNWAQNTNMTSGGGHHMTLRKFPRVELQTGGGRFSKIPLHRRKYQKYNLTQLKVL